MDPTVGGIEAAENRVWNAFFTLAGDPDNDVFAVDADRALLELDHLLDQDQAEQERQCHD
jgi:hypothetical protein